MPKRTHKIQAFHGGINSDADPRDLQPNQSPSLVDAAIDSVGRIKTLGKVDNGNIYHSGTALEGDSPSTTVIRLAAAASGDDDYYNGYSIIITDGTNAGEVRIISDYDAVGHANGAKTAVVSVAFTSAPDETSVYEIVGDANTTAILANKGLFVMNSDTKLDGSSANETLIFNLDNTNNTIDVKDSDAWGLDKINMGGASSPVYYAADGVVRVSDATFSEDSQWFGYIADQTFASLNATGPAAAWVNVDQSLNTPTSGKCLISNPVTGGDANGINSSASEYIGTVIDDGTSSDQVAVHSAINLRVGLQYDQELITDQSAFDVEIDCAVSNDITYHDLLGDTNFKIDDDGTNAALNIITDTNVPSFTISEDKSLVCAVFITSANSEYERLDHILVVVNDTGGEYFKWIFNKTELVADCWNYLVCSSANLSTFTSDLGNTCDTFSIYAYQPIKSPYTGNATPTYWLSGPVIINSELDGFQPGVYTFHHTYLYDDSKQESLPFTFDDVDSNNFNKINVIGNAILFDFDTYICSNVAAGNAYGLNKRITGSRLYWKMEENDNYYLIGELDFVNKGFKWLPEGDTMAYDMVDTSDVTAPILSKTAIVKGISPSSANIVDTYRNINGFSSEVKSLNAQYKTAVVQGRRAYIGNIKQNSKTHPDRILKSQVNRFDTFPEGMGNLDVAIRDGESIVKLEAFADRILQFKENSLYVINVSETIDFLEDTYRNKGCAYPYHTTKTDVGIAWFNIHGAYLYDGKKVHDLLEKNGMRLINETDWEAFITDGEDGSADDTDMSNAMIGYIPKKKQILIKNENLDVFIYDFVLSAWMKGAAGLTVSTAMTNFALDSNQDLFYIDNTTTVRKTWQTSPQSTTGFVYKTPDVDFGEPSIRKKIYKAYVSYKGDGSAVTCTYAVNGDTDTVANFYKIGVTGATTGATDSTTPFYGSTVGTDDWVLAELKPVASINNKYSFQLVFGGTAAADFEINDITIVYRMKNIK
jgi:hypothetical protein